MKYLVLIFSCILSVCFDLDAQVVLNNGGQINAISGAYIYVNGDVQNDNSGLININGSGLPGSAELFVTLDITNNADIQANGYIRLLRHWFDNANFTSTTGTVFLEGANQFLGGTAPTLFYNLTLDGTGIKTQQVDKFANGVLDLKGLHLNTDIYGFYALNPALNAVIRTTGFVSSANGGFLSRTTNSVGTYLFPVGSTANTSANIPGSGTFRYRPVDIVPTNALPTAYSVRLANLDATNETPVGYDRTLAEPIICSANPYFYHQINRLSGTTDASMNIYYDPIADGSWSDVARWNLSAPLWQDMTGASVNAAPLSYMSIANWNDFADIPYILTKTGALPPVINTPPTGGCSPQNITLSTDLVNGVNYTWYANGIQIGTGSSLSTVFNTTGCYDVTLNANDGNCSFSTSALGLICVEESPNAAFTANPSVLENTDETVYFNNQSSGAVTYTWNFGDNGSSVQVDPVVQYESIDANVLVTLVASTQNGCTDTATMVLSYDPLPIYYIPNSFTPDGNSYNQTWKPVFTAGFDPFNYSALIFNRWGEIIWESHDTSVGWDGSYGPESLKCQDGVYTYVIRFKAPQNDNKYEVTGHLTLIR